MGGKLGEDLLSPDLRPAVLKNDLISKLSWQVHFLCSTAPPAILCPDVDWIFREKARAVKEKAASWAALLRIRDRLAVKETR
jgi:hypothetical protein